EEGSKSRYGYFFFVMGALVSWTSTNSSRIMTSSTEAECHALVHASKENLWIREFLTEFTLCPKISPSLIFQDNKSSIALSVGGPSHRRSKHFGIEFDYYRERIELGDIQLLYRETSQLPADMLTKTLKPDKFKEYRDTVMGDRTLQHTFLTEQEIARIYAQDKGDRKESRKENTTESRKEHRIESRKEDS